MFYSTLDNFFHQCNVLLAPKGEILNYFPLSSSAVQLHDQTGNGSWKNGPKSILGVLLHQKLQPCLYWAKRPSPLDLFRKHYRLWNLEGSQWESKRREEVRGRANGAVVDTTSVAMLTCQCKPEAMHQTKSLSHVSWDLWRTSLSTYSTNHGVAPYPGIKH